MRLRSVSQAGRGSAASNPGLQGWGEQLPLFHQQLGLTAVGLQGRASVFPLCTKQSSMAQDREQESLFPWWWW